MTSIVVCGCKVNMSTAKFRSANLTAAEKEFLVELVLKYQAVIENKKGDAVTAKDKEAAWKAVAQKFSASGTTLSGRHTFSQLKQVSLNASNKRQIMSRLEILKQDSVLLDSG